VADEAWGLDTAKASVVSILLLRGPQTAAELRTRAERLHDFASAEEVEEALRELAAAQQVRLLDRQPGQKEARWQQVLAEEAEPVLHPVVHPVVAASAPPGSLAERVAGLEARIVRLETALGDLLGDGHLGNDPGM
jgi:uncharacterized protein YceH (UPF0502 family)